MKTAPTAAIEVLLGLPHLHPAMEAETQAGIYRLSCNKQRKPKTIWYEHAGKIRDMMKEPILQMRADKMIPMHTFNKPFTTLLPDRSEWGKGMLPFKKGGLIWYTDGSKTNEGTGGGVCSHGIKQSFSFSLGQYTQYSRQKYMQLKHVLTRILEGATRKKTSIFSLTVKLQSKHLTNAQSILN
jgi:hypothetical protein